VVVFTPFDVGDLILTSGKLIAADALIRMAEVPFDLKLKPGRYPVILSIANYIRRKDERVAYAMLSVSKKTPIRWEKATYIHEEGDSIYPNEYEFYGYSVDSGTGSFMDAEVEQILLDTELIEPEEDTWWWRLGDLLDLQSRSTWSWADTCIDEKSGANIIAFSSGLGDGTYPTYFGYDEKNEVSKIVTDFLLFKIEE
jgi:Protein of unknown function (DUF4241)